MEVIGIIRDEMTPKIDGGGISFTLRSRDYKGVMAVVLSNSNRSLNGEQSSRELLRSGRIQRNAGDGEWNSQCKL